MEPGTSADSKAKSALFFFYFEDEKIDEASIFNMNTPPGTVPASVPQISTKGIAIQNNPSTNATPGSMFWVGLEDEDDSYAGTVTQLVLIHFQSVDNGFLGPESTDAGDQLTPLSMIAVSMTDLTAHSIADYIEPIGVTESVPRKSTGNGDL